MQIHCFVTILNDKTIYYLKLNIVSILINIDVFMESGIYYELDVSHYIVYILYSTYLQRYCITWTYKFISLLFVFGIPKENHIFKPVPVLTMFWF